MDWYLFHPLNGLAGRWPPLDLLNFRPRSTRQVHLLLPPLPDPSFPSDHVAGAWALGWSLRHASLWLWCPMVALTVALMVACVYVGLHYPSDVIGGVVVGLAVAWVVERLWCLLPSGLRRLLTRLP